MLKLSADQIRENFLEYFKSKDHLRLPSYSLVPVGDPTLLIINAGMAPLKPYFKGESKPPKPRITTCQKCIRAVDIEEVGRTARHLTFFEMLGNFSFGDYYKKGAVKMAWEYFTKVLKIPEEILYVTVHTDDDEAERIWAEEVGFPKEKIFRLPDNFWGPVGDTGPCGPDSELMVDQGVEKGCGKPDCKPGCECDRYLELWNLVFTGLYKNQDGTYDEMQNQCIDTGMGFERLAAFLQGKDNVFQTELFEGLIKKIENICGKKMGDDPDDDRYIKVIADHVRSVTFMAGDGITPSNESRGYLMRRLIRRSVRFAGILGFGDTGLAMLVEPVVKQFGKVYPELKERQGYAVSIIENEEENFKRTLSQGIAILDKLLKELKKSGKTEISGDDAFELYDTYGFPQELTREIAEEKGFTVDMKGFEAALEKQRDKARQALKSKLDALTGEVDLSGFDSEFTGYHNLADLGAVLALFSGGKQVDRLGAGRQGEVVLDRTCFYGESGGQVGDKGEFYTDEMQADVLNTIKTQAGINLHKVKVNQGEIRLGDRMKMQVDSERRNAIMRHHTATHLLQGALREVLGSHVGQMGSLVAPDRLRFDFSHICAMTDEEIKKVEEIVNREILVNIPLNVDELPLDQALEKGALAFFGEKYDDRVRVVSVPKFSTELCGGTHVSRTGDIGSFKITTETAIGNGIRRVEAVCGMEAVKLFQKEDALLKSTAGEMNTDVESVPDVLKKLKENIRSLEKELKKTRDQLMQSSAGDLAEGAREIEGVSLVTRLVEDVDRNEIRALADKIANSLKSGVVILGAQIKGKAALLVRVTDNLVGKGLAAGPIVNGVAKEVGGKGGGKPRMAQAGGKDPSKLKDALKKADEVLKQEIGKMKVTK